MKKNKFLLHQNINSLNTNVSSCRKNDAILPQFNLFFAVFAFLLLSLTACKEDTETNTPELSADITATGHQAIDALTQNISKDSLNADLYAQRGALFYENEGYDNAIQDLAKAIKLDSTMVAYYHVLADAYLDYTQSRLALRTMETAAELFPQRIPTLLKLCEFQFILKKYQESLKTIDKILRLDAQNGDAWLMMGMNFREMGDKNRAINSFQSAVENNPDLVDAWINLGNLFAERANPLAENYFDNAINIDPENVEALHAKAYYLSNHKEDLEGAVELYKKINSIDPQYDGAFYNAGLLYLDLGKIKEGREQFDFCLKASPTHIRCYYYRGLAAEMLGDKEAAKADYEQALKMYPEYESAMEGLDRVK